MTSDLPEENQEAADDYDIDWDHRLLCSDGNCIGVIGADGCCKECGKKYEGELPETVTADPSDQSDMADEQLSSTTMDEHLSSAASKSEPIEDAPADDEWENRVLCSDGNCIGVIGPDGKCKECGKPLE
jgi:hypothetical protein